MLPEHIIYARHESEAGQWESARRLPTPALRTHIRGYHGYLERTAFTRRLQPPNGDAVIILGFGDPLYTIDSRLPGECGRERHHSFISGTWDAHVVTESPGGIGGGVQIDLTPIGAHLFSGLPANLLANRVIELDELFGADARELCERLRCAPTWEARFELLDAVFTARIAAARAPARATVWAWQRLYETRGLMPIGALADEVGYSRKHLAAQFRQHVGLPPKVVARVLRFGTALERLREPAPVNWADLAFECGYYDQAHFARDFRQFAGATPAEFLRRKLPGDGGFNGD
jgi:AraC-like DNA-binding protein